MSGLDNNKYTNKEKYEMMYEKYEMMYVCAIRNRYRPTVRARHFEL